MTIRKYFSNNKHPLSTHYKHLTDEYQSCINKLSKSAQNKLLQIPEESADKIQEIERETRIIFRRKHQICHSAVAPLIRSKWHHT